VHRWIELKLRRRHSQV